MDDINRLISMVSTLPGLGKKSATRIALKLLDEDCLIMNNLAEVMSSISSKVQECKFCRNYDTQSNPCQVCSSSSRSRSELCVVDNVCDMWALESIGCFNGLYWIIKTHLLEDKMPTEEHFDALISVLEKNHEINEVIIGINPTMIGGILFSYLVSVIKSKCSRNLKITSLKSGMPVGSEISYMDSGTVSLALNEREEIN